METSHQWAAPQAPCPDELQAPRPGVWHTPTRTALTMVREIWQVGEWCMQITMLFNPD